MKKYIPYIISVVILFFAALVSLACGVATTLPTAAPVKNKPLITVPTMSQQPTYTPIWRVEGSGGLYVRVSAGTSSPVIGEPLIDGTQIVIIGLPVITADGAQWVEIASAENGGIIGWVNSRYLEAVK